MPVAITEAAAAAAKFPGAMLRMESSIICNLSLSMTPQCQSHSGPGAGLPCFGI
jgi:hypothetical protein